MIYGLMHSVFGVLTEMCTQENDMYKNGIRMVTESGIDGHLFSADIQAQNIN